MKALLPYAAPEIDLSVLLPELLCSSFDGTNQTERIEMGDEIVL